MLYTSYFMCTQCVQMDWNPVIAFPEHFLNEFHLLTSKLKGMHFPKLIFSFWKKWHLGNTVDRFTVKEALEVLEAIILYYAEIDFNIAWCTHFHLFLLPLNFIASPGLQVCHERNARLSIFTLVIDQEIVKAMKSQQIFICSKL